MHCYFHYLTCVVCQNKTIKLRINSGQIHFLQANITTFSNRTLHTSIFMLKSITYWSISLSLMYRLLNKLLVYLTTRGLWVIIGHAPLTQPPVAPGALGDSHRPTLTQFPAPRIHTRCGDCIRFPVTHNRLGRTIRAWVMLTALHRIMETSVTSQRCFLRLIFGLFFP